MGLAGKRHKKNSYRLFNLITLNNCISILLVATLVFGLALFRPPQVTATDYDDVGAVVGESELLCDDGIGGDAHCLLNNRFHKRGIKLICLWIIVCGRGN